MVAGGDIAVPRFRIERVYDRGEGPAARVLVDRLWPRGVRKEDLPLDRWAKDLTPSTELRRWYGHDPARFAEFAERYREELAREPAAAEVRYLEALAAERPVVLLTATKDLARSGASVLLAVLG
jgi:uncharacterized protein YeaO (DUF488 family)